MKTLTYTAAIFMAMAATSVFAHHPSADMNPNYDTVDAQLEAVDSPHFDMDVSDMGANTETGDSAMEAAQEQAGSSSTAQEGPASLNRPQNGDGVGPSMIPGNANTMNLLEEVAP